jgi:hypothetical protein
MLCFMVELIHYKSLVQPLHRASGKNVAQWGCMLFWALELLMRTTNLLCFAHAGVWNSQV